MSLHHRSDRGWLMASVVATAFVALAGHASAQSATYEFNIPSQKLSSALTSYGTAANQQIIFSEDLVGARISPPLQGRFTPEEAVRRLLTGSGLTAARTPKGVLLIQRAQSGLLKVSTETRAQGAALGAGASSDAGLGAAPAPVAAATDPSQTLSDVIVTAERREASAQRTPIAMSVLSPDTLQRNGVSALSDLARIAPSVNFSFVRTNAVITIRGVSSRDTTEIGDPAVSTSIDGFFYQRTIGLNDSVFDLERVEVLRGPQGTLYGRNATGGAINFITAKPKAEFGASLRGGFGNYNSINTEGMVNVPVTNWLAVRASFATRSHDGYRNNAPGPNGDDAAAKAARIHLLFTPTDRLRVLLTGETTQLGGVGPTVVGAPLVFSGGQIVHEMPTLPSDHKTFPLSAYPQFLHSDSRVLRGDAQYDLGAVRLTYLFGYRKLDFSRLSDVDGTQTFNYAILSDEHLITSSHELRLSSMNPGPLQWQTGLFYFREDNNLYSTSRDEAAVATATTAEQGSFLNYFRYPHIQLVSQAAFFQGSYEVVSGLKLEGGIRYTIDHKERFGRSISTPTGPLTAVCDMGKFGMMPCPNAFKTQTGRSLNQKFTYHAALNWQATPQNLLYAKYDTGYKSGGFSDIVEYGPESLIAYEVGSKNRFVDNKFQLNASAYYYDYTNQQVNQIIDGRAQTVNAGKSRIYGVELEGVALLAPTDRIDGSLSYLNARFVQLVLGINGVNTNLAGSRPAQSPDWSFNAGYEHDFSVWKGLLTARLQTHGETSSFFQLPNANSERQRPYMRSDLLATFVPHEGNWQVQAYVRNIGDVPVLAFARENASFKTYNYQYDPPRTYGVEVSFKY